MVAIADLTWIAEIALATRLVVPVAALLAAMLLVRIGWLPPVPFY